MAVISNKVESARNAFSITPSDSTVFHETRGLFVGTGGDLNVLLSDDSSAVVLKNVASGSILPISVTQVLSTSTTASDIVALY